MIPGQTNESESNDEEYLPLSELAELVRTAQRRLNMKNEMTLDQYVNIDRDVQVNCELGENWQDDFFFYIVRDQNVRDSDVNSVCDDDDELVTSSKIKTHQEALEWIRELKLYCLPKDILDLMTPFQTAEDMLEKQVVKVMCGSKQTTLDPFFKPSMSK